MGTLIRLAARRPRVARDWTAPPERAAASHGSLAIRGALLLVSALALGLAGASCSGSAPQATASLRVGPCKAHGPAARCGTLTVPENWLTGKGRRIKISFVVFPAYGHPRAPDPVVYFAGGPGTPATSDIPNALSQLTGVNRSRDLVFIDQRGTGGSNGLSCPQPPGTLADRPGVRRSIESCLSGRPDLRFYTTAMAADDAAHVLTVLHYGKVNLYGASYGATTAQVFLQLFPGRVRTMTLLSGSLLSVPLFERFPQASQQALDVVFARCASTPACHRAFPHLAADWATLRASVAASPLTLPARQSPIGTVVRFDSDLLARQVHLLLLRADTAVMVPLFIHTLAAAKHQQTALVTAARQLAAAGVLLTSGNSGTSVISYPIRCAEPWARLQPGQLTGSNYSYYYPASLQEARWWQYVCALIPAPRAAARYGPQTTSRVPVLMLNGSADPQDPPANMAGAQQIWPNSRLLIEPGQGHGISDSAWAQCDLGLVQAFIEHASANALKTGCLGQVALPPFQLQG